MKRGWRDESWGGWERPSVGGSLALVAIVKGGGRESDEGERQLPVLT